MAWKSTGASGEHPPEGVDEEQIVEAHRVAGLLAHLADGGVGRVLAEVQAAARQRPLRTARARPAGEQHLLGSRADHGVGGDPLLAPHRRSTKNDSRSAAHSFSSTPATTSGRWFWPTVAQHVPQRPGRAGARLPRAEHHPGDPGQPDRARAHGARLHGDGQRAAFQPPLPLHGGRGAQGEDLGVRGGVAERLAGVAGGGELAPLGVDDDGADRHVTGAGRGGGDRQGPPDQRRVGGRPDAIARQARVSRRRRRRHCPSTTSASASPNPQRRPIAASCSSG